MTPKKKALRKTHSAPRQQSEINHRLDALLHTMRCISQHHDALCELSHEVKQTGSLSPELRVAMGEILQELPADDYLADLDAVKAGFTASHSGK